MNLVKRINIGISLVVLAACAAALLVFGWSATGWKAMAIPTGSMRPGIPPGSLVLVHRVPVSSLKVGDVITHIDPLDPKITLSHRIIKAYKVDGIVPAFVTKGDANKAADVPIVGGQVIGKVIWHIPYIGWLLLKSKNPWVILPVVYIAGLLIMIEEVIRLRDYFRLAIPYRAAGFVGHAIQSESSVIGRRLSQGTALTAVFVVAGAAIGPTALAALHSSPVSLTDNRISVKAATTPPAKCWGNNSNSATINNTTTQNGHSGNVFVSGNKGNTGNVSSGNVSNTNTTTITVNQSNGC